MTEVNLDSNRCRVCPDAPKMKTVDSRPLDLSGVGIVMRRKKCPACGETYRTAEIPLEVAEDVFAEDPVE